MTAQQLWTLSLGLAALGALLLAMALAWQLRRSARAAARVDEVLQARENHAAPAGTPFLAPFPMPGGQPRPGTPGGDRSEDAAAQSVADRLKPPPWLRSGLSKALFADEDRKLMELAGVEIARGGLWYVIARAARHAPQPAWTKCCRRAKTMPRRRAPRFSRRFPCRAASRGQARRAATGARTRRRSRWPTVSSRRRGCGRGCPRRCLPMRTAS